MNVCISERESIPNPNTDRSKYDHIQNIIRGRINKEAHLSYSSSSGSTLSTDSVVDEDVLGVDAKMAADGLFHRKMAKMSATDGTARYSAVGLATTSGSVPFPRRHRDDDIYEDL